MCKSKVHLSWQMLIFWSLNFLLCTAVLTIIILLPIKTYLEFFKSKTKKIMNTASIYMYLGLGPRIDPSTPQPPYDFGELFEEHPKNIKRRYDKRRSDYSDMYRIWVFFCFYLAKNKECFVIKQNSIYHCSRKKCIGFYFAHTTLKKKKPSLSLQNYIIAINSLLFNANLWWKYRIGMF